MKTLFLLLLMLPISVSAQEKCEMGIANAPEFHNFKLGMSTSEVSKLSQITTKTRDDTLGQQTFAIMGSPLKRSPEIRQIVLQFLDNKLFSIYVRYNELPFTNSDEFLDSLSSSLNLPRKAWVMTYDNTPRSWTYELGCNGFKIILSHQLMGNNSYVAVVDTALRAELDRRIDEQLKQKQKVFKP